MKSYLKPATIFIIAAIVFTVIQFNHSDFLGQDAYYHAKVAEMIGNSGHLLQKFPWLQYTILKDNFVEHHLLFHILLIPFVTFFNVFTGGKIAIILFSSLFITVFYIIISKLKLKYPLFWSLMLLGSSSFLLYRLNLLRAQSLALILLFIGIYALIKKKWLLLFIISIFYTWLFDGFIILGIVLAVYLFTMGVSYFKTRKIKSTELIMPLLNYLGGVTVAIILNPYFPANLYHLFFHLYKVALHDPFTDMPVGIEWDLLYPSLAVSSSLLLLIFFILSIAVSLKTFIIDKNFSRHYLFLGLLSVAFFFITIVVRKMIEYSAPMIILFSAYSLTFFIKNDWNKIKRFKIFNKYVIALAILILFIPCSLNLRNLYFHTNSNQNDNQSIREAGKWMAANIPPEETIYHVDWSEFSQLFFYNPGNFYISGLDPNFMKDYDEFLYRKWYKIFNEQQLESLYATVKFDFKANYIYFKNDFSEIKNQVESDMRFNLIYSTNDINIYSLE